MKLYSFKECVKVSTIHIHDNVTISITRDCKIHLNYCLEAEAFLQSNSKYTAVKSGIKFLDGEMNACLRGENGSKDFKDLLKQMGIPSRCTGEKYKACNGTRILNFRPWKRFLPLLSGAPVSFHMDYEHDNVRILLI